MLAPTVTGIMVTNYGYNAGFVLAGAICLIGVICAYFVKFDRSKMKGGECNV